MQSTQELLKQNRKQRRWRLFRLIATLSCIFGTLYAAWHYFAAPGYALGNIVIEGSSKISRADIVQMGGSSEPVNLLRISSAAVKKALSNDLRFETADVKYMWPAVLHVSVKERVPAVYLACAYKGYAQVDYNGVVLEVSDGIKDAKVPVLSGLNCGNMFFGDTIQDPCIVNVLQFLSKLDKSVLGQIAEVAVDSQKNVKIWLRKGYPVLLGSAENVLQKFDVFVTVYNEIKTKEIHAEYIDLTFSKPYIRLKQ